MNDLPKVRKKLNRLTKENIISMFVSHFVNSIHYSNITDKDILNYIIILEIDVKVDSLQLKK